jgi:hypothetical protein
MARCAAKPRRASVPLLLGLTLACALIGCESRDQIRQAQERQCASDGLQPGTVPFAACLQRASLAQSYRYNQSAGTSWGPPHAAPAYAISPAAQGAR